jgi:hypothetical protein
MNTRIRSISVQKPALPAAKGNKITRIFTRHLLNQIPCAKLQEKPTFEVLVLECY